MFIHLGRHEGAEIRTEWESSRSEELLRLELNLQRQGWDRDGRGNSRGGKGWGERGEGATRGGRWLWWWRRAWRWLVWIVWDEAARTEPTVIISRAFLKSFSESLLLCFAPKLVEFDWIHPGVHLFISVILSLSNCKIHLRVMNCFHLIWVKQSPNTRLMWATDGILSSSIIPYWASWVNSISVFKWTDTKACKYLQISLVGKKKPPLCICGSVLTQY